MSGGDFLDSNVFVYLFDETDAAKRRIAASLVNDALASEAAAISHQVVQETLNVITRRRASAAEARAFMASVLMPLWRVMPSEELYREAIDVRERYQYSFYDSLIIAAALQADCRRLFSEDLQHGQRIGRLVIENPFRDLSRAR